MVLLPLLPLSLALGAAPEAPTRRYDVADELVEGEELEVIEEEPVRPPPRSRREEEDPDDGAAEDELFLEVPRVLTPPGFGRVRFELQGFFGAPPGGGLDAGLGLELRIGLFAPVALALGGGAAYLPGEAPFGFTSHGGLRVQAPLEPAPYLEGGVVLRDAELPPLAYGGLGVALSLDETQAVGLGARGLFREGELGLFGVVGLYFAP